ncbi:c-type cytochrome [Phenylobacterium deserti]|uniref:Cytochrome c family protein n=1 Tax=Phenylobacterium deserti TaxID=1914756 RepID=A0A328A8T7_9CAUL|nr:cytochrome c family protein [Phenylobacterium deserti]RAK50737.1 cytochrome c family protein [Phenylobacterium deserti]
MRRHALPLVSLVLLGAALAACGKSPTAADEQRGQAASSEQPATPGATAAAELTEADKQTILASLPAPYNAADLQNGQRRFALCRSCHTIAQGGPNMTGPNLHGVVGQKAAVHPKYNYSEALKSANLTWDPATLDRWIENPRTLVPGNKMTFVGIKDPKDRADLIAYLAVEGGTKPQ